MKTVKSTPQHAQCQLERFNVSDQELLESTLEDRRRIARDCGIERRALTLHYRELVQLENRKRRLQGEGNYDMLELMFWEEDD